MAKGKLNKKNDSKFQKCNFTGEKEGARESCFQLSPRVQCSRGPFGGRGISKSSCMGPCVCAGGLHACR